MPILKLSVKIAQSETSVTAGDDDYVYTPARDDNNFVTIVEDNRNVYTTAEYVYNLAGIMDDDDEDTVTASDTKKVCLD